MRSHSPRLVVETREHWSSLSFVAHPTPLDVQRYTINAGAIQDLDRDVCEFCKSRMDNKHYGDQLAKSSATGALGGYGVLCSCAAQSYISVPLWHSGHYTLSR